MRFITVVYITIVTSDHCSSAPMVSGRGNLWSLMGGGVSQWCCNHISLSLMGSQSQQEGYFTVFSFNLMAAVCFMVYDFLL